MENQKKFGTTTLISHKVDFNSKKSRDKRRIS